MKHFLKCSKSRSLKEKILIVVITILSAAAAGWLADTALRTFRNNGTTDANILKQEWVKNRYENYGLTIETPWKLTPLQLLPEQLNEINQLKEFIISMDIYENADDASFKIILNISQYSPDIEFNIQAAAEGTMNGIKNQPGVTHFVYDEQPYQLDSIPGFIQKGTFRTPGEKLEFTSIGLSKEDTYYQLIISTISNDDTAKKATERIINSIEIE